MKEYLPDQIRKPLGRMRRSFENRPTIRRMKRRILLELNQPTEFNKTDLIHLISKRLKLRNYLELCTPTAGRRYGEIDRARFYTARRLMYIATGFDDGLPIDYKIADFNIEDAVTELKLSADKVDICLVDAFHTYDCTTRDLKFAYELLADGGVLVVHDCSPPNEAWASPTFASCDWSGESYRSYLDFVLNRDDLDYCTVDVDFGCGVIFKNRTADMVRTVEPKIVAEWFEVHNDSQLALNFFFEHRAKLLRLMSGKDFVRRFRASVLRRTRESQLSNHPT
jgi:SAM-dependent methyltransferase